MGSRNGQSPVTEVFTPSTIDTSSAAITTFDVLSPSSENEQSLTLPASPQTPNTQYSTKYADSPVIGRPQSLYPPIHQKMGLPRTTTPTINTIGQEWNRAVDNRSRWPRAIYCMVGVVFIGFWIGVMVILQKDEQDYQQQSQTVDSERPATQPPPRHATGGSLVHPYVKPKISLDGLEVSHWWIVVGKLLKFDPNTRTLSIKWTLEYVYKNQTFPLATHLNETFRIGIFPDQLLVPVDEDYHVIYPDTPDVKTHDFRIANASARPIAIVGATPMDSFLTEIDMGQRKIANPMTQPNLGFPFDLWTGNISFVANLYDYAVSLNPLMPTARGFVIKDATLVDSIMNWRIIVHPENSCMAPKDGKWEWIAEEACTLNLMIRASRPLLVILACIIAVIVNWLSTIFIFIMTCEGVIMRRFQVIMGPQLLAVCFTALFALPSVRSILPGAPEFGSLNLIGIVPNVIIISICTILVAVATLRQIVEEREHADVEVGNGAERENVR
ncbi:hypothetical protein CPB86DRAFT_819688 [Serendipita vermifera]|nr:hypothetical protein CPB86DRAFT_819688 [Serendipita vermifera]